MSLVVEADHDGVGADGGGVVAGVVGPGDGGGMVGAYSDGRRADIELQTLGQRDLVVVERYRGAGAGDGLGKVVADGGIELGLGRGVMAVADVDESERRAEEAADEGEAGAAGLLGGSVGVVYMIGDRAHDVAALPESANDGADFAGETTEDALFDDTHDCKRLRC